MRSLMRRAIIAALLLLGTARAADLRAEPAVDTDAEIRRLRAAIDEDRSARLHEAWRWTWYNTALEATFLGLVATDWAQTNWFLAHGHAESNRLLGAHPSMARRRLMIGGMMVGHPLVMLALPRYAREGVQVASILAEGAVVLWWNRNDVEFGYKWKF